MYYSTDGKVTARFDDDARIRQLPEVVRRVPIERHEMNMSSCSEYSSFQLTGSALKKEQQKDM